MNIKAHYKDFEADFIKKNRSILMLFIINTLVFATIVIFLVIRKERFIFTQGKVFKEEMLKVSFCAEAFKNVTSDTPSTYFLTDEIYKLVVDSPFLLGSYETLYLNDYKADSCKIIVKTDLGLKAFLINLDKSSSYPLQYKLKELIQIETNKNEI